MAGFTGGRKPLGIGGYPIGPPPPTVTETTNVGTDIFYLLGFDLAEASNPTGSSNPPVNVTETGSVATDTYYILGMVLAESGAPASSGGTFQITETGSVGADTYYVFGFVLREH